jgi:hypothetical protein
VHDKKPVVFWRGSLRGFSTFDGSVTNIRTVIKRFRENALTKDELIAHLDTVPRYAFVSRYFGVDGFDIGFNRPEEPAAAHYFEIPEVARYQMPFADPAQQKRAKYLISIQGTDVGSSFGWQVSSNSVLLKEAYGWEVFFDCHFRPWEHFVPVEKDFSDVQEKVAWCEKNPDACRQMIENRHSAVPLLLDSGLRDEVLRRVIHRYNDLYSGWESGCRAGEASASLLNATVNPAG